MCEHDCHALTCLGKGSDLSWMWVVHDMAPCQGTSSSHLTAELPTCMHTILCWPFVLCYSIAEQRCRWQCGIDSQLRHLDCCFKQVVVALGLGLGVNPVLAPYIHTCTGAQVVADRRCYLTGTAPHADLTTQGMLEHSVTIIRTCRLLTVVGTGMIFTNDGDRRCSLDAVSKYITYHAS